MSESGYMGADPRLNGTRGTIFTLGASYDDVVRAFGQPAYRDDTGESGDYKTRVMWIVELGGRLAVIYDWKRNGWRGLEKVAVEEVDVWCVSGSDPHDVAEILAHSGLQNWGYPSCTLIQED